MGHAIGRWYCQYLCIDCSTFTPEAYGSLSIQLVLKINQSEGDFVPA